MFALKGSIPLKLSSGTKASDKMVKFLKASMSAGKTWLNVLELMFR